MSVRELDAVVDLFTFPPVLIFFPSWIPHMLYDQLDSLEDEKANLASQCEELRLRLQQQRENREEGSTTPSRTTDSFVRTDPENAEVTAASFKRLDWKISYQFVNLMNPAEQQCKPEFRSVSLLPLV